MKTEALLVHRTFLTGLARSLVYGDEDADDVVQETYVAALSNPPRHTGNLRAWLARILRNAILQRRRSRARRGAREEHADGPAVVPQPAEILAREEIRRTLVHAVVELPEAQREAVYLRYHEDLPPREIARRLDVPVNTVKTRLKRALAALRDRLDDEHEGDRRRWALLLLPLCRPPRPARFAPLVAAAVVGLALFMAGAALLTGFVGGPPASPPAPPATDRADLGTPDESGEAPNAVPSGEAAAGPERKVLGSGGWVMDADGKPAPGAYVVSAEEPGKLPSEAVVTDREGHFDLVSRYTGRYLLALVPGKSVSRPFLVEAGVEKIVLTLGPGGIARGTVRHPETGVPVAGARVELVLGTSDDPLFLFKESGDDGTWSFEGIPLDVPVLPRVVSTRWAVCPDATELRDLNSPSIVDELVRQGRARVFTEPGEVFECDLQAIPTGGVEITFEVRPPEGGELPASLVFVHTWTLRLRRPAGSGDSISSHVQRGGDRRIIDVDESGKTVEISRTRRVDLDPEKPEFTLFFPRGMNRLRVRAAGLNGGPPPIEVSGDEPPRREELRLQRDLPVFAQLVDENGAPLRRSGVEVTLRKIIGHNSPGRTFTTGPDGRADLTSYAPPADPDLIDAERLLVTLDGEGIFESTRLFPALSIAREQYLERARAAGPEGLVLSVPARAHRDLPIVVCCNGEPVPGVVVRLEDSFGGHGGSHGSGARTGEYVSDDRGRIVLELRRGDLGLGERLVAKAPWRGSLELHVLEFDLRENPDRRLLFRVRRVTPVRVRCLDENGRPMAGRKVTIDGRDATTGPGGWAKAEVSSPEKGVSVRTAGYLPERVEIDPASGEGEARLSRGRVLHVTFTGHETGRLDVSFLDARAGKPLHTFSTDDDEIESTFPDVPIRIRAFEDGGTRSADVVVPVGCDEFEVVLTERPRYPVRIRFVDRKGRPLADTAVQLFLSPEATRFEGATDGDGGVELRAPEGDYRLFVHAGDLLPLDALPRLELPAMEPLEVLATPLRPRDVVLDWSERSGAPNPENIFFLARPAEGPARRLDMREVREESPGKRRTVLSLGLPVGNWTLAFRLDGEEYRYSWSGEPGEPPAFHLR